MPSWWVPVVQEFFRRLTPLFYGSASVTVTSFIRTRSHNAEVGGVESSQHLIGTAADLVPADGDMAGLAAVARQFGLVAINEGDHVHVQLFPAGYVPGWIFDQVARA